MPIFSLVLDDEIPHLGMYVVPNKVNCVHVLEDVKEVRAWNCGEKAYLDEDGCYQCTEGHITAMGDYKDQFGIVMLDKLPKE